MRLAIVCNNYGQKYDGIGSFAKILNENYPDDIKSSVFSADCLSETSALKKVFNFGMIRALRAVRRAVKNRQVDAVLIEYPFVEWNPFIVTEIKKLRRKAKKNDVKIFASIHEYERVNFLRKLVITRIVKYSDVIFVSDESTKNLLSKFNRKIYTRSIPSNIQSKKDIDAELKCRNDYAYFGLVNSAKAFDEMIKAWDEFNINNRNTLYVLTASKLEGLEDNHKNVKYCYCYSDEQIAEIMLKCTFCILPIKPEIDNKNGTFKTSCIFGCLAIGHFCSGYSDLPFIIDLENYSVADFVDALNNSQMFNDLQIKGLSVEAVNFSKRFMPEQIAKDVAEIMLEELNIKNWSKI